MSFIDQGWQYRVYDTGTGRVSKIYQTRLKLFLRAFFSKDSGYRFKPVSSIRAVRQIESLSRNRLSDLKKHLGIVPPYLFGNPTFKAHFNYNQDKATPFKHFFATHTLEENKVAVSGYISLILELWKYGISDAYYNYHINSGVDNEGRVIQIDLGDFVFERECIENDVRVKRWLGSIYYNGEQDELKEFCMSEMDRLLTLENLDRNWRVLVNNS